MLIDSNQKGTQSVASFSPGSTRITQTADVQAEAKSFMLLGQNTVNPTFRLLKAGAVVRHTVGMAGRGCWKKPRPLCNRADRSEPITLPRKRADFWRVVHYENAGRTFTGGNRK